MAASRYTETKVAPPGISSTLSSIGIFSLEKICMDNLLANEHGMRKEDLKLQLQGLYDKYEQYKLDLLNRAICNGDLDTVEQLSEAYPFLLLIEPEEKAVVTTCSGQRTKQKKPYQMALAEEDTQIAAMLRAKIIKIADEKEADAQYLSQFPPGWKIAEEERWAPILTQFDTLAQAIIHATPNDITSSDGLKYKLTVREESEVGHALARFRSLLDATLNEIVTIGRHFCPELLQRLFEIYHYCSQGYFKDAVNDPRPMLFWRTIGLVERLFPANYVQAACDGLDDPANYFGSLRVTCNGFENTAKKLKKGISQGRSSKFELFHLDIGDWVSTDFYPLSKSRLGYDFTIGALQGGMGWCPKNGMGEWYGGFDAYVKQKQQAIQSLFNTKTDEVSPQGRLAL